MARQGSSALAVEFHIRSRCADTCYRRAPITVEVCNLAVRGGDAARIENVARPTASTLVVRGEYVKLKSLTTEPGDNIIAAISV